jgi:hypothetical protein
MLRTCELGRDESIVLVLSMVIGSDGILGGRAIGNTVLGIREPGRDGLRSLMGIGVDSWERVLGIAAQGDLELVRWDLC